MVGTFVPSAKPNTLPNVVSISIVAISCSLADEPLVPDIPSLFTTGASLRLLGMPVQPRNADLCGGAPFDWEPDTPADERY